jgi:hypothetical protein
MKALLFTATSLLCFATLTRAQNPYADALASFDTSALRKLKPEVYADQIRKDLVLQTISNASSQQVRIDLKAAGELDNLYAAAGRRVAAEPKDSEQLKQFPANSARFIGELISLAKSQPRYGGNPVVVITPEILANISYEMSHARAWPGGSRDGEHVETLDKDPGAAAGFRDIFCPCWPFC